MSGKPGASGILGGRPKSEKTLYKDSLDLIEGNILEVTQVIIDQAVQGKNLQACFYLHDRLYGKPKQAIDQTTLTITEIGPELRAALAEHSKAIRNQDIRLLSGDYTVLDEDT